MDDVKTAVKKRALVQLNLSAQKLWHDVSGMKPTWMRVFFLTWFALGLWSVGGKSAWIDLLFGVSSGALGWILLIAPQLQPRSSTCRVAGALCITVGICISLVSIVRLTVFRF
jgi:hypothetical protein